MSISSIVIIVVNYGTAELTIEAVKSVLGKTHGKRSIEIHVVDNASPGDDAQILKKAHKANAWGQKVTLHLETTNHGFGRGNNVIFDMLSARTTPPDAVFLLNPDASLENETLDTLAMRMETNPKIGFAGAGISNPSGEERVAAFRFPSISAEFSQALGFGPVTRLMGRWQVALPAEHPEADVDWVAGAALLIRWGTLQEIGFFDPDFFLYFEEVELMWRGAQAGWRCRYVPEARVVHIEGAATDVKSGRGQRKRYPAYRYASWRLYFSKTHSRVGALCAAGAALLGAVGNWVISWIRRRDASTVPYFISDFWQHAAKPIVFGDPMVSEHIPHSDTADPFAPNQGHHNKNPKGIGFWALVAEDYRTNDRDFFSQGFWALFWHRFGNWRMGLRPKLLRAPFSLIYKIMYKCCEWFGGIMLPYTVRVGRRVRIDHFGGMILVAHTIGDDVIIRQNTTFGIAGLGALHERPIIEAGVDIGAGAVIVGRVRVGAGAKIGANAVVVKDVEPNQIVGGVPARPIGASAR